MGSSVAHRNEVLVVGRVAAEPQQRALPSGDVIVTFRVVVERAGAAQGRPRLDVLDCCAWSAVARRSAQAWVQGDVVEVRGALRRRFWRSTAGPASRYEIEVDRGRRLARAPAPASRP